MYKRLQLHVKGHQNTKCTLVVGKEVRGRTVSDDSMQTLRAGESCTSPKQMTRSCSVAKNGNDNLTPDYVQADDKEA